LQQDAQEALLQTVSALGFTPTARAKFGLVVAQAAETQTRLERFTGRPGGDSNVPTDEIFT
jgi:phage terminase small subunit